MDDNTAYVICTLVLFCWIPILSLGKAVAWIVESCEDENGKEMD